MAVPQIATDALAKMSAVQPTYRVIQKLAGARSAAFDAVLPEDTRQLLAAPPPVTEWVPLQHIVNLCELAFTELYDGRLERVYEQGELVFGETLRTYHKYLIRLLSPEHFVRRMALTYSGYYKNHGAVGEPRPITGGIEVTLTGAAWATPVAWTVLAGNLAAPFKLMHLHDVSTAVVSGGGTARSATLRATWRL